MRRKKGSKWFVLMVIIPKIRYGKRKMLEENELIPSALETVKLESTYEASLVLFYF
jgi:hypothetical protein